MIQITVQRNGKYWQARWYHTGRQHGRSLGRSTKREANAKARELERELNDGILTARSPTLHSYAERFLRNRPALAPATITLYGVTIASLCSYFGPGRKLDAISRPEGADWWGSLLREGRGAVTVSRYVRQARTIFSSAVKEGLLAGNPFDALSASTPVPDRQWQYVELPTLHKLLAACPSDDWRLLLALCRLAGLRQGEALRLQWGDVDLNERILTVRNPEKYQTTKARTRKLPISPELYRILAQARRLGQVVQLRGNLWRQFRAICRRAQVEPWARWCHTLRKNCATDWGHEVPLHVVSEWLGNSPVVAMKHYLRAEPLDYRKISRKLG